MPRSLKVFEWHSMKRGDGSGRRVWTREIMAAASIAEVLRETGIRRGDFDHRGRVTNNQVDCEWALAHPHQAFWRPEVVGFEADLGPWHPFGASIPAES
jgi:hypothetical protein